MKSYFQVARKYISSQAVSSAITVPEEPAITVPSWKYYRRVTYNTDLDWAVPPHLGNPYKFLRIFIHDDEHLRDHAQLNGFDIFFVDPLGYYMPAELVYYANGTGEWWIRPGAYSNVHIPEVARLDGVYNENNHPAAALDQYSDSGTYFKNYGWVSYRNDSNYKYKISFYVLYGDRTDADHQNVTTDPTRRIWSPDLRNLPGVIAHSSYIHDVYAAIAMNGRAIPYEENFNAQDVRPINSVLYAGHTSGYTSIDTQHSWSLIDLPLETVGNGCSITPVCYSGDGSAYTDYRTTIPIYQTNSSGEITDDGKTSCLVFGVAVPKSSVDSDDPYKETVLFAYRGMMIVLTEGYNSWNISSGLVYEYTPDINYPNVKRKWYTPNYSVNIPEDGCALGYVVYYSTRADNGDGTYTTQHWIRVNIMPGTAESETLPTFYGSQTYPVQSSNYEFFANGIAIGDPEAPAETVRPEGDHPQGEYNQNFAGFGLYGHFAHLLEIRDDIPVFTSGAVSDTVDYEQYNQFMFHHIWNMVFNNENRRTISQPYVIGGLAGLLSWNRIKTYQGLNGGCN